MENHEIQNETTRQDIRKAMAFDLIRLFESDPQQAAYSVEEIKRMIKLYITAAN